MKQLLAITIALLATSSLALAQPGDDDPAGADDAEDPSSSPTAAERAAVDEARELYREGNLHYAAGRYKLAAERFERAYELAHEPVLLFNLGNAWERAGDYERAASYLRRYLSSGKVHDVVSVRARIERLDHAIAERRRVEEEEEEARSRPPATTPALTPANPTAPIDRDRGEVTGPSRWPYVVAGAGVVTGAAVAVSFGLLAGRERDEIDSMCQERDSGGLICAPGAESSLDSERTLALVSDVGTAVAASSAVAALIYFLSTRSGGERDKSSVTLAPTTKDGGIGITAAGRF